MTDQDQTVSCAFAKLFALPGGNQLAIYRDPEAAEPALVVVTRASGIVATTRLTLNNEAPVADKEKALEALLGLFDWNKAREVQQALVASISDKAPLVAFAQQLSAMTAGTHQPFAHLVTTPSGEHLLAINDDTGGSPFLSVISATAINSLGFESAQARAQVAADGAFLQSSLKAPPSFRRSP